MNFRAKIRRSIFLVKMNGVNSIFQESMKKRLKSCIFVSNTFDFLGESECVKFYSTALVVVELKKEETDSETELLGMS